MNVHVSFRSIVGFRSRFSYFLGTKKNVQIFSLHFLPIAIRYRLPYFNSFPTEWKYKLASVKKNVEPTAITVRWMAPKNFSCTRREDKKNRKCAFVRFCRFLFADNFFHIYLLAMNAFVFVFALHWNSIKWKKRFICDESKRKLGNKCQHLHISVRW